MTSDKQFPWRRPTNVILHLGATRERKTKRRPQSHVAAFYIVPAQVLHQGELKAGGSSLLRVPFVAELPRLVPRSLKVSQERRGFRLTLAALLLDADRSLGEREVILNALEMQKR